MTATLAGLCAALLVAGVFLVIAGARRVPGPVPRPARTMWRARATAWWNAQSRRQRNTLMVGTLGGVVLFALTGWVLALVVAPVVVVLLPSLLLDPPNRQIQLLEALDRWVRALASSMPTGKSVTDAIRSTRHTAPEILRPSLDLLVARLDERWTLAEALYAMADEMGSADADGVIAALIIAAQRGGSGATATLTALGDSVQNRLAAAREIEAERAKPRIVVRQVTAVTVVALVAALVTNPAYFAPFTRGVGQLIALLLAGLYLGALAMLRRMAATRQRDRILQRRPVTTLEAAHV